MNKKYIQNVRLGNMPDESSYLYNLNVIKSLSKTDGIEFNSDVTFFVGENGMGKSTLLEAIAVACGFNPEGGTKNFKFSTKDTHSNLSKYLTVSKFKTPTDGFFLRAESFYNVSTEIDRLNEVQYLLNSYGGKSLHEQSHGESFLSLIHNRFNGNGLYILDEPESALSPLRQMVLISEINELVKNNSQFIIATHSPILLAFPNAEIYEITEENINLVSYKETEHYKLTKSFLDNPDSMLKYLLED